LSQSIHEMVTQKIIEKLEAGVIPWRKPWRNGGAVNWKSQKAYRGINCLLLEDGEYATFKQITEAGGIVKKGAKSEIVVFWKWLEDKEDETKKIPLLRYYRVFNVLTQCEGLESRREEQTFEHDPIEACENIIKGYINKPTMYNLRDGAWYKPFLDYLNVPPIEDFPKVEEYYATTFHEMIHSTGHSSRLNREGISTTAKFGSEDYSKEELVAEIGASMLSSLARIDNDTFENSVSYIQSWLKVLKNDKTLLVKAGSQSQKAVDYILGTKFEEEN
jgi:antirestriction protein ArdC